MNEIGTNRSDSDKHFKLMADVDLSSLGIAFNIIGNTWPSFEKALSACFPTPQDTNKAHSLILIVFRPKASTIRQSYSTYDTS